MKAIRDLAIKAIAVTGIGRIANAILAKGRFVLMFHGITSRDYPDIARSAQSWLTADELRSILSWLGSRYDFLSPEEFLAGEKDGLLLTFDDGLANNFTNALPVLTEFGIPAVFFVSTQHVIQPTNWLPACRAAALGHWKNEAEVPREIGNEFWDGMSVEQLKKCADHPLITIGGHTISHPHLPMCSPAELEEELASSRQWLQSITGQSVDLFAYPYSEYNRVVVEATCRAGYRAAFADNSLRVGQPDYEIPRIGIYYADPAYLDLKLSGLYRRPI